MNNIEAVLFDLDGTLIDSEFFYFSNWQPILSSEFDFEITFTDWIQFFAGHTLVANVDLLKKKWGIETTVEFMWKETRANYAKSDMRTIQLMPHAREILEALHESPMRIGLVTSSYRTTVDTVLGHHNLLPFFEFFVTREKVTEAKPAAEPYLLACDLLGLPKANIVAVEDTITGFSAAKAAGISCIAVSEQESERAKLVDATHLVEDLIGVRNILL
ncbi:HAD family hydrolase [Sphingobacterium psychroaquaticum]|uniref:Haloacid dehalogenase superfamily, subfamily IA, variant 3 with third motif having DD or ED/haloacid dehalogenase superfamily, subfamily IA, variant 1 with third motif having Dx(3-4)D or Dx(3-4)E n=1 Tax=Sphingobacterium psychroaquaticum TaxID=561061 RepID=A0A1X7JC66_9SPHI|nr:HAD family phosphatase [Sphingobacterium psychroaquaticum]SMG25495.1 haloacid dehalogenase superfamily, subfamily IA, variant 3 with third motif having DD or ED/haloacid dehalogenase superfamily, subfamily IA, variant 1 with third motif having Dx(3-4)D or Dx(3-4)E [Sphingobacterium psychroaquaticum]